MAYFYDSCLSCRDGVDGFPVETNLKILFVINPDLFLENIDKSEFFKGKIGFFGANLEQILSFSLCILIYLDSLFCFLVIEIDREFLFAMY